MIYYLSDIESWAIHHGARVEPCSAERAEKELAKMGLSDTEIPRALSLCKKYPASMASLRPQSDGPCGSFVPADTPVSHIARANVLTLGGVRAKHDLSLGEARRIQKELLGMPLGDILFSFADGPRYDMCLYLVAHAR